MTNNPDLPAIERRAEAATADVKRLDAICTGPYRVRQDNVDWIIRQLRAAWSRVRELEGEVERLNDKLDCSIAREDQAATKIREFESRVAEYEKKEAHLKNILSWNEG